jgi:hypothetical protein
MRPHRRGTEETTRQNTNYFSEASHEMPLAGAARCGAFFCPPSDNEGMDDIVRQAIAKWPNVPHCFGWLGLDARGNWYMRDDRVQAAGPFPQHKGSLLKHEKLVDFIARNYEHDEQGQWFFQNGPQRVYVELELAPLVWRIGANHSVTSHTGGAATPKETIVDEDGRLYLATDIGFGLVHTLDMEAAANAIEQGLWNPQSIPVAQLPARYGFIRSPAARQPARAGTATK